MATLTEALTNPANYFHNPHEILDDPQLTLDQKIQILKRWEYDIHELAVAEEENMAGGEPTDMKLLDEIHQALIELGAHFSRNHH